jgi:hypothetical protein
MSVRRVAIGVVSAAVSQLLVGLVVAVETNGSMYFWNDRFGDSV